MERCSCCTGGLRRDYAYRDGAKILHAAAGVDWDGTAQQLLNQTYDLARLLYESQGPSNEARALFEEALVTNRKLAQMNPQKFLVGLPGLLRNVAQVRGALSDEAGAKQAWGEAARIEAMLPSQPSVISPYSLPFAILAGQTT